MSVVEINTLEEFHDLISQGKPTIVDFYATWCGPCKMIAPTFAELAEKHASHYVSFCRVDIDKGEGEDIATEIGVRGVPMFVAFQNEERLGDVVGANQSALEVMNA
ncbi:thioredoxin domain-containing protein [Rickenella mellea]|uniref:Thioredoxin n=1 Tax=Rickenella mellea TaxID=50990 RepID=A0A4Y7QB22_9AGAM|nr:thioredoxin domain-containing protein [Rickenella mellea]